MRVGTSDPCLCRKDYRGSFTPEYLTLENSGDTILNSPRRFCAASNFRAGRGQAKDLRTEKPALSIPLAWTARGNLYPHFLSNKHPRNLLAPDLSRGRSGRLNVVRPASWFEPEVTNPGRSRGRFLNPRGAWRDERRPAPGGSRSRAPGALNRQAGVANSLQSGSGDGAFRELRLSVVGA